MTTAQPGSIEFHPAVRPLPFALQGPFARCADGRLVTVDGQDLLVSSDQGATWARQPLFRYGPQDKECKVSNERALLCTASGTLLLSFLNLNEKVWSWRDDLKDTLPGSRLPHCAVRSLDGGQTWRDLQVLHEDWTGDVRTMIALRSGRIVLSSMRLQHNPGRHSVLTYSSADEGATWTASNIIDLGGCGHHGGVTEATVEELRDGRLWLLLRTNWMRFWQAFSDDGGLSWREIGPSPIPASSAPGQLRRLASGRLVLLWNRPFPEGTDTYPLTGGDGLWSEVPVSNHRAELSLSLSADDGQTWGTPAVIARRQDTWLAYPRIFEAEPGVLWISTMQGNLCACLNEADFA
jgi:hypothetical protein